MRTSAAILVSGLLSFAVFAANQEPSQAPPPPPSSQSQGIPAPGTTPAAAPHADSSSSGKKSRAPIGYLLTGTIFTEKALAFPGARIQVRKENERKFRWETYANSRGEFALRVPEGQAYEVVVKEKHYKEKSVKFNSNSGELEQRLSLRLELEAPKKDSAKK